MVDVSSVGGKFLSDTVEAPDKEVGEPWEPLSFSCGKSVLTSSHKQCSCCSCVASE